MTSFNRAEPPKVITINGVEYPVDQFSPQVKHLVEIHTVWRNQLQDERLSVAKTESALKALDAELTQLITTELTPADKTEDEAKPQ